MAKLRWTATGETTADWEERLYHIIVPVHKGIAETDDDIAIQTLLRSGYELVSDEAVEAPVASKASTASKRRSVEKG